MAFLEADARNYSPYLTPLEGFNPSGDLTLYNSQSGESLSEAFQAEFWSVDLDRSTTGQHDSSSGSASVASTTRTTGCSIAATAGPDSEPQYYQGPKKNHHHRRSQRARPHPGNQESLKSTPGTDASTENSSDSGSDDSDHAAHSMEIDDWKSKPWRYNPEDGGSLRLAGFPYDAKRYQGYYFTAPFWLWSSGQVSQIDIVKGLIVI
jgi:hypothetical protein